MITLSTIIKNETYDPIPGLEYEVGDGVVVSLEPPTLRRIRLVKEQAEKGDGDFKIAQLCAGGAWPETDDDLYPRLLVRIIEDFSVAATPVLRTRGK